MFPSIVVGASGMIALSAVPVPSSLQPPTMQSRQKMPTVLKLRPMSPPLSVIVSRSKEAPE